jgi:hypothetical protein
MPLLEVFMGKYLKIPIGIGLAILVSLLAGCAGRSLIISSPAWYRLKSGLYDTDGGKVFYGIGQASGVQNQALLRATADNQARKELADVLENYLSELARSAEMETDPNRAALSVGERQQILGMLVHNCLQLSMVSDHWNDANQSGLFALCRLDLTTFKQVLSDSPFIDEKTRAAMWAEAERVHARLSQKGDTFLH